MAVMPHRLSEPKAPLWLLALSLAGNAFLIVLMVALWRGPPPGPPPGAPPPPEELLAHLTGRLPAADAAVFRQAIDPYMPRLRKDHARLAVLPDVLRRELAAEAPDPERLRAALEELNAIRDYFGQAMVEATIEAAPHMTRQGREMLWRPPPR
jgi:hypothetical protein